MTVGGGRVRRAGGRSLAGAAALVTATMIFLLWKAGWDVRYLWRVLRHRDSGTSDFQWKRSVAVAASSAPMPWPTTSTGLRASERDAVDHMLPPSGALALVVVHQGAIRHEWYGNGGAADRPAAVFSISKSVLSLLVARAVDDGSVPSLDAPVTDYLPELADRDPRFGAITLGNLLDMRSGIAFSERVQFPWVDQDPPTVYYASDLARTVVERPRIEGPPGAFVYNDYAPNLVGLALARATGRSLAEHTGELWDELGAEDPALWSTDDRGFPYHESGFVATARDLARVGTLMLTGGTVGGRQVAPESFLRRSFDPVGRATATTFGGIDVGYRNGWWVLARPGSADADLVAMGDHGQVMLVSPATDSVLVRLGAGRQPKPNITIARHLQQISETRTA